MARVIGIDLGSHTVKLAVMEGRLGNMELTDLRLRTVPLPEPVELPPPEPEDEDGPPPRTPPPLSPGLGARLATLAGLLEELSVDENTSYALALPADKTSVRLVPMPFADRDRITQTLPFELEGYVPFDVQDFVLDWRVQPVGEGARVLAAMAPKQSIGELLEGLEALGVDPKFLVLDADILGAYAPKSGTQAVIDVGHERTILALVHEGEVQAVRALSRGGRHLSLGLAERTGMSLMQAEAAKLVAELAVDPGVAGPAATPVAAAEWEADPATDPLATIGTPTPNLALKQKGDIPSALIQALDPLLAELRATLIALEDELGHGIDEVLLTGGSAGLQGLTRILGQDLGVPVRRIDLGELAQNTGDPDRFGLAVMLAQKAGGIAGAQALNFRKGEFVYKGDLAAVRTAIGVGLVALFMFALVGSGLFVYRVVALNSQTAELQTEMVDMVAEALPDVSRSKLEEPGMARAILVERVAETQSRVDALAATVGGEPPVLSAIMRITELVPRSPETPLDISQLTVTETTISFKAQTSSFDAASKIEKALQSDPLFSQAKRSNETKAGDGIRFDMSIPLTDEEEG